MKFTIAVDRNEPDNSRAHYYAHTKHGLLPMCGYGWNRSDGSSFSVLRGWTSRRGTCKLCERNITADKPPVKNGFPHKTKWL